MTMQTLVSYFSNETIRTNFYKGFYLYVEFDSSWPEFEKGGLGPENKQVQSYYEYALKKAMDNDKQKLIKRLIKKSKKVKFMRPGDLICCGKTINRFTAYRKPRYYMIFECEMCNKSYIIYH